MIITQWLMIILCCISVFLSLPASERNLQRKIYGISYGIVLLTGIWSYSLTKRYSGTSITDQALVDLLRNYSFVIIPLWVVYAAVLVVFLVMSFEIDFGALEWFRIILSCITLLAFTSLIIITYCCHEIEAQSNSHGHNSGLAMVSTISNKSGVSDTNHSRTSTGAIKLHNNNDKDSLKNMKQKKMKLEMMPTNGNINRSKVLTPSSDKSETVSVKNEHQIPLGFVDENEPHKNTLPKTSVVNTNTNSLKLKTNQSVESQEDSVQDDDEKYGKNEQKNYIPSTQPLKRNISIPWHDNMVPRTYNQSISRKLSDKRSNIRSIHLQPTQNQSKSMSSNISSTRQPLDFSSKEIVDPMPQFDNDNSQMHLRGRQESGSRAIQRNSKTDSHLYDRDDQVELSAMTTIIHQSSIVESINASNDLSSNESERVRNNSQDITQVERTSNVQNETKEDDTAHFKSDDGQIH